MLIEQQLAQLLALQQQILCLLRQHLGKVQLGDYLDNADLKQLLKVGDKSIYRLRKSRQLGGFKIAGKWYYPRQEVMAFIERGMQKPG